MKKKEFKNSGELIIYGGAKGGVELKADIKLETIWASLDQIAKLFGRDKSVISRHLKNLYSEKELDKNATVAKNATVQIESGRKVVRYIEYYYLDAILSVGYRVNSIQATHFRQWATKTLKEFLLKGIALNTDRIKKLPEKILKDLDEKIRFIQRTIQKRQLNQSEADGLLSVIDSYSNAWLLLKEYDENNLILKKGKVKESTRFNYEFVQPAINV